jgi:putative ABC transport system permease protein
LTTIGIIIGIATVIIVFSVGESAKTAVADQLMSFGSDTVFAEISVPNTSHTSAGAEIMQGVQITSLKESDLNEAVKLQNVESGYAAIMIPDKISHGNKSKRTTIIGTNHTYPVIDETRIKKGRFFNFSEEKGLARVVVIGPELAEILFPGEDPINKNIRIKQTNFKVIGVTEEKGTAMFMNMDEIAIIPLQAMQKLIMGIDYVSYFVVKVENRDLSPQTADDIRRLLRKRHKIPLDQPEKDDFQVTTMDDALEMVGAILGAVSLLLTTIAIISLIVGGVGIMNIMYVSVSERTHEIGLRKAIGATEGNILSQFLFEAIGITLLGGILGIAFGVSFTYLASVGANQFGLDWNLSIPIEGVVLAFGASAIVGIVFGLYPAQKASKLDPIIALTRE